MQFANDTCVVEKSGIKKEKKFGIVSGRKIFNIFFDRLYSNKIRAIIRELYSNAYDAHRSAGTLQTQPLMHLPTLLAPEFYIRDFGTGIAPKDIDDIYTVVFESTKTGNNEDIGGFGVGSKTPYCYTDNFTVRSFYNGKVYTYAMYIDQDGEPTYSLVNRVDSDEPNGLEVKFAVERKDFSSFSTEAVVALQHFELKPKQMGQGITFPVISKEMTGKGWYINKHNYYGSNQPHILVGPVKYPLDIASFKNQLNTQCTTVGQINLVIEAEIKDVEVAPSREALSYSERTINFLKGKLQEVVDEITATVDADIKHATSDYNKKALYRNIKSRLSNIGGEAIINTKKLFTGDLSIGFTELEKLVPSFKIAKFSGGSLIKKVRVIFPCVDDVFYFNDGSIAPHVRCTEATAKSKGNLYLLSFDKSKRDEVVKYLGINDGDLIDTGRLVYNKTPVVRGQKDRVRSMMWQTNGHFSHTETELDVTKPHLYVLLRHNRIFGEDDKSFMSLRRFGMCLNKIIQHFKSLSGKNIVAMRTDAYKRVKNNKNFVNLFAFIREEFNKLNFNENWEDNGDFDMSETYNNLKRVSGKVDATSLFAVETNNLINKFRASKNNVRIYNSLVEIKKMINGFSTVKSVNPVLEFEKTMKQKYPLLYEFEIMEFALSGAREQAVVDYINLMK